MRKWKFLLLVLVLSFDIAKGQRFNFKNFHIIDGLSQSQVTDVIQDKFGYVWIATYGGGVDKFDGAKFQNFNQAQGLQHYEIKKLLLDSVNNVWCGLERGFISIIQPDNDVINIQVPALSSYAVTGLSQSNGIVYVSNSNGQIVAINQNHEIIDVCKFSGSFISDIVCADNSIYAAVRNKGVCEIVNGDVQLVVNIRNVNVITKQDSILWFGLRNKLVKFSLVTNKVVETIPVNGEVVDIVVDKKNHYLWLAIMGKGLAYLENNNVHYLLEKNGLPTNLVSSLYSSNNGLLWIGTDGGGLSRFSGFQFVHYLDFINKGNVPIMGIEKDNNNDFWFASYGYGLIRKHNHNFTIFNVDNSKLTDNSIYALTIDRYNNLWVTTKDSGLFRLNLKTGNFAKYKNKKPISKKLLYVKYFNRTLYFTSKDSGIYVKKNNKLFNINTSNGLIENYINYIYFDENKNLWIASENNGIQFIDSYELKKVISDTNYIVESTKFKVSHKQISPHVLSITQDNYNRVYFGTIGDGLLYMIGEHIYRITKKNGLLSNNIYALSYNNKDNSLWISTDKGLNQIKIIPNRVVYSEIKSFSYNEGFTGIECNRNALYLDTLQDNIWIGTIHGATKYRYKKPLMPVDTPSVNLISFKFGNTIINSIGNEQIVIPYNYNNVVIHFKSVDQWQPKKIKYQWKIVGLDNNWHPLTSLTTAEYSFIPPGEYSFVVRVCNGNGVFSKNNLTVSFKVKAPFTKTIYFYIIVVLLLLIFVILFFQIRQKQLNKRNANLQKAVTQRTQLLQKEKLIVEQQKEELRAQTDNLELVNVELEKLSLVASKTENAVLITDSNFNIEWVNLGFTKMYGYTLEQFINEKGKTIIDSSSVNKISHIIEEATHFKKSVVYTSKARKRSGEEIWVQSTLTPVYDDDGALRRVIIIDSDINDMKKINNELKKLSLVASKTDNSVIVMNRFGKIEWVNAGFHRLYELNLNEIRNLYTKSLFDIHPELKGNLDIDELFSSKESKTFTLSSTTTLNIHKWIQSVITPIRGANENENQIIAVETDITRLKQVEEEIILEKKKSESLLLNILPTETAEELKSYGYAKPRYYKSASILFADFKDFTLHAEGLEPEELVAELKRYFDEFDDITERHYVEKIKTIGDAYMCAGGIPIRNRSHVFDIILTALDIQSIVSKINSLKILENKLPWEVRIGIHTGDLVAGVIGKRKFAYDTWGETVNIASRMESACEAGRVNVSGRTYEVIKDYFDCTYRGKIKAKNIGKFDMYFIDRIKVEYSDDENGMIANDRFKDFLSRL